MSAWYTPAGLKMSRRVAIPDEMLDDSAASLFRLAFPSGVGAVSAWWRRENATTMISKNLGMLAGLSGGWLER